MAKQEMGPQEPEEKIPQQEEKQESGGDMPKGFSEADMEALKALDEAQKSAVERRARTQINEAYTPKSEEEINKELEMFKQKETEEKKRELEEFEAERKKQREAERAREELARKGIGAGEENIQENQQATAESTEIEEEQRQKEIEKARKELEEKFKDI